MREQNGIATIARSFEGAVHAQIVFAATISAGALFLSLSAVQAGTLIPLSMYPGSISTFVEGINNSNVIVGDYTNPDGTRHAFVGTIDGNYASFDAPSGNTLARGINDDGYIVGWGDPTGDHLIGDAFVRMPDGTIVPIKQGDGTIDGFGEGITQHVKFVGEYWVIDQQIYTYGFYGKGDRYVSDLTLPFNTMRTHPRGYNKSGTAVGWYTNDYWDNPGFVLSNGVATSVRYPYHDPHWTFLESVNDKDIAAGYWYTDFSKTNLTCGAFLFDPNVSAFKDIPVAGASCVVADGINDLGLLTINTEDNRYRDTPYIYCTKKKTCPQSPKAIEIPDKWIKAPPGSVHSVVCAHGCIGPWHGGNAAVSKVDRAAIRDAMKNDPALRLEMGSRLGH